MKLKILRAIFLHNLSAYVRPCRMQQRVADVLFGGRIYLATPVRPQTRIHSNMGSDRGRRKIKTFSEPAMSNNPRGPVPMTRCSLRLYR